jgi:peptidoglycan hydrolase-like protein with peptidoglycan-binding domain
LFAGVSDAASGRGNGTDAWTLVGTTKSANIRLPAGTYEVHVGSPSTGEITPANSTATIVAGETTTKTYNAAASMTLVTLTGTVSSGGEAVANANVWASRVNGPGFFSTQTAADGTYTLNVPDEMSYRVGVKIMGYVASEGDVTVTTGGNKVQNFTLTSASATITGAVTGTAGAAVTNGWVSAKKIVGSNEVWTGIPTDASGNYSLTVDSGTWTVYADGPCYYRSGGLSAASGSSGKNISLTAVGGCTPPTPEVRGVTAASGGQVARENITLDIPANALGTSNSTVSVSVSEAGLVVSSANATPLRNSVQSISATDSSGNAITSLNNNVSLTITYDPNELPVGFDESEIQMGYFDTNTGQWEPVASTVDTDNNTITAQVNHFTDYGPIIPGVPDAPNGLSATAASAGSITLSWTASPTATSYKIYRSSTDSGFTTVLTSGITSTSHTDTGLTASTRYYYEVAGVNDNGEGPNSSSANATTNAAAVTTVLGSGPVGGGGGGGIYIPPVVMKLATTTSVVGALNTATSSAAVTIILPMGFSKELEYGMTNNDVRALQERLIELGFLKTSATGFYGPATRVAVQVFQRSKSIVSNGRFGPLTMAAMNSVGVQAKTEATSLNKFTVDLRMGMTNEDVRSLQIKLKELGYFNYPEITGLFGSVTKRAVQAFQQANGIVPVSGFVGSLTRAKLNEL